MSITTKKIATLGIITSLALISFMIEALFPPLFIVGAKVGISNIFVLLTLVMFNLPLALAVVIVKTVLGSVFAGNISMLMYSLSGGIVSTLISALLLSTLYPKISIVSVSILSAVSHNITQNLVYVLVSNTPLMMSYLPYLALIGVLSGIIVGLTTRLILHIIPLKTFLKVYE
ncbi:MAG: Gx transporter family protein [Clostridia bacterium]